jgi:GTPase SAR1 family protein
MFHFKLFNRFLIVGSSSVGKSTFVKNLILNKDQLFEIPPKKIYYCARSKDSVPEGIEDLVVFIEGLPSDEILENSQKEHTIIVIDDLQTSCFESKAIVQAYQSSRTKNLTLITLIQNLFPKAKFARDITLNTNVFVFFYNPRDLSSINSLSRQITPNQQNLLGKIYQEHVNSAYKYLVVDVSPTTHPLFKFKTNIFSPEFEIFVSEKELNKFIQGNNEKSSSEFTFIS